MPIIVTHGILYPVEFRSSLEEALQYLPLCEGAEISRDEDGMLLAFARKDRPGWYLTSAGREAIGK